MYKRQVINAAVAVELFHNFTLVHDDIMDNANKRRGRETSVSYTHLTLPTSDLV